MADVATPTAWTTSKVRSLQDLRGLIAAAWKGPESEQRIRELLESERGRAPNPRVMYTQELERALEEGAPTRATGKPREDDEAPRMYGLVEIPLDELEPWPELNPRKYFAPEPLQELAESIQMDGVQQPILVNDDPKWVVAGERRLRAARMAGLKTIPAIVRSFNLAQALRIAVIENVQRAELSAVEEARGLARYLEESKKTQEEVAHEIGRTQSYVANRLRLLRLGDELLEVIEEGVITPTHARDLLVGFTGLREGWTALASKLAAELRKAHGGSGEPLDEMPIRRVVVKVAGPGSKPLAAKGNRRVHVSKVWELDQKLSYDDPLPTEAEHKQGCDCGAPAWPWQHARHVRCFNRDWWNGARSKAVEETKRRDEEKRAKLKAEAGEEPELVPVEFEWPNRSKPMTDNETSGVEGDWGFVTDRWRGGLDEIPCDPDALDPELLYWYRPQHEEELHVICADRRMIDAGQQAFRDEVARRLGVAKEERRKAEARGAKGNLTPDELPPLFGAVANGRAVVLRDVAADHGIEHPKGGHINPEQFDEWLRSLDDAQLVLIAHVAARRYAQGDVNQWGADQLHYRIRDSYAAECAARIRAMLPEPELPDQEEDESDG